MPGSGKSLVSEKAASLGLKTFAMGDIIREEADSRGIVPTPSTLGKLMLELREKEGADVIAKRSLEKASRESGIVVIEGVRSLNELNYFRCHSSTILVAVHASPHTRFQRLLKRGRADDPNDFETFNERDTRELNVGMGSVIALADKVLINEGTVDEMQNSAGLLFLEVMLCEKE